MPFSVFLEHFLPRGHVKVLGKLDVLGVSVILEKKSSERMQCRHICVYTFVFTHLCLHICVYTFVFTHVIMETYFALFLHRKRSLTIKTGKKSPGWKGLFHRKPSDASSVTGGSPPPKTKQLGGIQRISAAKHRPRSLRNSLRSVRSAESLSSADSHLELRGDLRQELAGKYCSPNTELCQYCQKMFTPNLP